jgi:hypothetical protein
MKLFHLKSKCNEPESHWKIIVHAKKFKPVIVVNLLKCWTLWSERNKKNALKHIKQYSMVNTDTLTLILYIGSLPSLATWFPCGRGRTPFILGSLGQRSRSPLPKINRILPLPQGNHVVKFGKDPIYRTKVIMWKRPCCQNIYL